jgi:hypothetical protein
VDSISREKLCNESDSSRTQTPQNLQILVGKISSEKEDICQIFLEERCNVTPSSSESKKLWLLTERSIWNKIGGWVERREKRWGGLTYIHAVSSARTVGSS